MKGGTRAAVGIGVGYVLGRRRKMRLATVLAVGAATGGIAGLGGSAVRRGAQALGSTEALGKLGPQFGEIADTVRGDLVEAGKAAAVAAVSGRIDALTDSLHDRAESLRNPAAAASEAGEAVRGAGEGAGHRVRSAGGRGRQAARPDAGRRRREEGPGEPEDPGEDEYDEPADDEAEYDEADDDQDRADEDQADEDGAAERRPAPARRRAGARGRAPVSRTRR
jgi:hypothetical protein